MVQVRTGRIYEFDGFQLYADERLLLRRGDRVALHGKAFEMLLVLVRHRGRLLTKDELFGRVWPDQIVEESNLTVNMSAIRRALGERANSPRYITTVSGRGYRFTDDVRETVGAYEALTVESETFTRVVVEQEEETDTSVVSAANFVPAVALTRGSDETLATHAGIPANAIAPTLVAHSEKATQRWRTRVALFAALLGVLLLVGAGSVWLYQSRNRGQKQQEASAPLPASQITMRRFTTAGGVPYRVALSPDGKSLVYLQRIKGKDSLWLGQIETNSSVQINKPSHSWYGYPVFAPDGNSIYFTVQDDNHPRLTLVRMPVVGGAFTELIQNVDSPVTFSPDGRQLAFLREDQEIQENSIVIADADGQRERTLGTRRAPEKFSVQGLSWSPDGKTIAVAAARADNKREELLAVSVADGNLSKIGSRDWGNVGNLVWLPDASGVVIAAEENDTPRDHGQIWLVTYPDGAVRKVTDDVTNYQIALLSVSADGKLAALSAQLNPEIWIAPEGDVRQAHRVHQGVTLRYEGMHGLAWTPDGRLLYIAYIGESQTIWSMNSDGSNPQQLTSSVSDSSVDNQVSVTADGRYMVFHSNRSGDSEIWRAHTDGSDLKQLTSGGGNSQPSLSPEGRWIVYASARDGQPTLWRISIAGGEATQITTRHLSWPEVSPDGKQIACIDPTTLPRWRLMVIPFAGGEPFKSFAVPRSAHLQRRLRWTPDEKAIMYQDSYQGLWRQALDQEEPQLAKGFEEVRVFQFTRSFDGKNLAYTAGVEMREIILIENFK